MLAACGGGGGGEADPPDGGAPDGGSPAAEVARITIEPAGVLLTPDAPEQQLVARAFDADGEPVDATIEWSSNRAATITVDADGAARAVAPLGSALLTASVGDVEATVFALAAEPVSGAVVVRDDQIVGEPVAVDPEAAFGAGFRYDVELAIAPPPVGTIVLASGARPVAGRIVAIDGARVTVEQVAIDEVFAHLAIDEQLVLDDAPAPAARDRFAIGPFECELAGSLGGLGLATSSHDASGLDTMTFDLAWDDALGLRKLAVRGQPAVTFELQPMLEAELAGSASCRAVLKEYQLPLPGPARLFLGASVVVGVGVELGGTIPVAGVGINLRGEVRGDLDLGLDCGDECVALERFDATVDVTPTLVAPELALRIEPEAQAFLFAEVEGGARFSSGLRTEAFTGQAGFELAGSFASEETQAADTGYQSSYRLTLEAEAGPGEGIGSFFDLIGLGASFLRFEHSEPLGGSPTALLSASQLAFAVGDDVTFAVDLADVSLPALGYNVDRVRVYRREPQQDGSVALILVGEQVASPDQTHFEIVWDADVDGSVGGNFLAYVATSVLDLIELEVATAEGIGVSGILTAANGTQIGATDGYTVTLPPGIGANPGADPLPVGVFYYSSSSEGILVCERQEERSAQVYVEIAFAHDVALAPGTYPFADWSEQAVPNTFGAFATAVGGCIDTEIGPACKCPEQLFAFDGGSLTITQVDGGGFSGTVSLQSGTATSNGTFTIPACDKTFEEHNQAQSPACLPP